MKKNILVTGVMGHLGYSFASNFSNSKNTIVGIYNITKDLKKYNNLKNKKVILIKNNLSDIKTLKKIIQKHNIESVVYSSAVSHEIYAKEDPFKSINVNSLYLINFLNLLKENTFSKFIYISTGSVFQDVKDSKFKINTSVIPSPKSIYSSSKRLGEVLVQSFFDYYNLNSVVVRVSWVYGMPVLTEKINFQRGPLPFILNELFVKNKSTFNMKTGSDFKASFTYIKDVVNGIQSMLNKKAKFTKNTYHLSNNKNYSLKTVEKIINTQFRNKKVFIGKGVAPWSSDSVIRGPMQDKDFYKEFGFKCQFDINKGLIDFIKQI